MKNKTKKGPAEPNARARLLETAIDMFAEKGYAGTSVREIVHRAGVSKPVLYYYFQSKEGLFLAILDMAENLQKQFWNRKARYWIGFSCFIAACTRESMSAVVFIK